MVVFFVDCLIEFECCFGDVVVCMYLVGGFWVVWLKKVLCKLIDIIEDVVCCIGFVGGLVDNKVCVIDDVWLGFCFVICVENCDVLVYWVELLVLRCCVVMLLVCLVLCLR